MIDASPTTSMPRSPGMRRYGAASALAILGLTALTGCDSGAAANAPAADAKSKDASLKVAVVKPTKQTIARLIQQPGYVKAYEETPIYSKIAGFLDKEPKVDKGSVVHKGDLLVQLRVPEMEADVRSKEARVRQATAEIKQAEETLHAAAANVQTSDALVKEADAGVHQSEADSKRWRAEWERAKVLVTKNVYDKQTLDEALNQLQQSEAMLEKSRARVTSAQANLIESKARQSKAVADIEAAKARKEVAAADKEVASCMLDYRNIRAPYDGIITERNVHTDAFVQPSSSGSNNRGAEPLFVIMRVDIMRVTVQVPEFDGMLIRPGMPASIHFQALSDGDHEFKGTVTRTTKSLDQHARTLLTEIDLPNPNNELAVGLYANVTITSSVPNVWTLPNDALISDEGGKLFCFCVENGKAVRTPVRAGTRTGKITQLVKKQSKAANGDEPAVWVEFTGNEQIVARNASSITDGQAVTISRSTHDRCVEAQVNRNEGAL